MDTLMRSVGFGVHSYQPFRRSQSRNTVLDLQYACKCVILRQTGLKRLKNVQLPLPKLLLTYLTTFSTNEFEEIESAPFTDAFNLHYCHRALTYRVRCKIDQTEYLATYDCGRLCQSEVNRQKWTAMSHNQIMCVYAIVIDEPTCNHFYLLDTPVATLENVRHMLLRSKIALPEDQLWKLVHQLSAALLYLISKGLGYGPFNLDNLYLVGRRVMLENELTKKSRLEGKEEKFCKEECQQRIVANFGRVLKKLVYSSCLIRSNTKYSDDLLKMIEDSMCWDPVIQPRLETIRFLSKKMLKDNNEHSCREFAPLCYLLEAERDVQ